MKNLKQKSLKAFAWDFTGKIAGQTVTFIISIFLARLLSPQDFGLLAMVNVIVAISGSFMDMGLGVSLVQRKNVDDSHYSSVFFFNIIIGFFLATLLFFSSGFLAKFYQRDIIEPIAKAMSLIFVISSFGNVIRSRLKKTLEFGIIIRGYLIGATVSGICGIILAIKGFGVWSLVAQSILNPAIANSYLFYRVKWRPKLTIQFKALKELFSFGFRMFLSGLLDAIFSNLDALIIGKFFSPANLGYYYRSKSLNNFVVQYSSGSLMNVLFPALSNLQDDLVRFKQVIYRSFHLICFTSFFMVGVLFLVGEDIITILFTSKWEPSIKLFKILILSGYVYPVNSLLVSILSSQGNSKAFLNLVILKEILLLLNYSIGFLFGIEGFLYGYAVYGALATVLSIYYAARQINEKSNEFYKIILPYLSVTVILTSVCYYTIEMFSIDNHYLHLMISVVLFAIGYYFITSFLKLEGRKTIIDELKRVQLIKKILGKS